jgi:hypothetical protein
MAPFRISYTYSNIGLSAGAMAAANASAMNGLMISIADDAPLSWSHAGDFPEGASTLFYVSADLNLGIIVLTNGWPAGVPQAVIATFDVLGGVLQQ